MGINLSKPLINIDPSNLQLFSGLANTVAGVINGGPNKTQKAAEKNLPGYEADLKTGIPLSAAGDFTSMAIKGTAPGFNALASKAGSKFGRSGYARGAATSGLVSTLTPQIAEILRMRMLNNQQNLRQLYSTNASIAAGI